MRIQWMLTLGSMLGLAVACTVTSIVSVECKTIEFTTLTNTLRVGDRTVVTATPVDSLSRPLSNRDLLLEVNPVGSLDTVRLVGSTEIIVVTGKSAGPAKLKAQCRNESESSTDYTLSVTPAGAMVISLLVDSVAHFSGIADVLTGDSFTYSWEATNATACIMNSPVTSGIALKGSSVPIPLGSAFYPSSARPTIISIVCTDGVNTASNAVVVRNRFRPLIFKP